MSRLRTDPVRLDEVIAVLLLVFAELQTWLGSGTSHRVIASLLAVPVTGAVALRRKHPLATGLIVQGLVAGEFALWGGIEVFGISIAWFCAIYALTVWTSPRRFVASVAYVAVTNALGTIGPHANVHSTGPFTIVTMIVMILVRRVVGDKERRAELAERERDVAAREAVVEERARIARELHDVIAHNVSMMVVQAGAERRTLPERDGSTGQVFKTIEEIGRSALTEMRRLVGMLRADRDNPLAPQPGLADLPTLVTQVREAGLAAELQLEGEQRRLPEGIELSAYRIVQEALTNALKHAGRAEATVRVRYGRDELELEIADSGAGPAANGDGGHGLVGMRERVALYGGQFEAGAGPRGGFVVKALLPIR